MQTAEIVIPGFVRACDAQIQPGRRLVSTQTGYVFTVARVNAYQALIRGGLGDIPRWFLLSELAAGVREGRWLVYRPRRRGEPREEGVEMAKEDGETGRAVDPNAEFIPEHLRRDFPVSKEDVWEDATEERLALAQAGYFETMDLVDATKAEKAEAVRPFDETLKTLHGALKKTREYIQQRGEMVERDVLVEVRGAVAIVFDPDTGVEIKRRTATDQDRNLWSSRGRGR